MVGREKNPESKVQQQDSKQSSNLTSPMETENDIYETIPGVFRGVAAATRKVSMVVRKSLAAKAPAAKTVVKSVGQNRPLAFASEGAVAGESMIPRGVYYGAWGLSGAAIVADIFNKQDQAPPEKRWNTVLYWTAFHVPASLVVPAAIIHRIVHSVETVVQNPKGLAKSWSPGVKRGAPVAAALICIVPVVPLVDHAAEGIMEPTFGKYLELEFDHHQKKANKEEQNPNNSQLGWFNWMM